jgi:hypothetical protein
MASVIHAHAHSPRVLAVGKVADVAPVVVGHIDPTALRCCERRVCPNEVILPVVVGQQRLGGVCVWPDERHAHGGCQRQNVAVVLKEDERFARCLKCDGT